MIRRKPARKLRTAYCKLGSLLLPLLLLALGLVLPGCLRLDSFLFEPYRVTEYLNPTDIDSTWHVRWIIPDSLIEAESLTGLNGNKVYAFFVHPRTDTNPGLAGYTVLYSHGRSHGINRYWGRVELLWETGASVFIYDYEGFGMSEGTPSGPACFADAEAALAYIKTRPDVDTTRLVQYGWSLGTFMTCYLAADIDTAAALILENPMASTSAIATEGAVLTIPGGFVADADFDNERRIRSVGCRTLLIYGDKDQTAVPARNAEVLIEAAKDYTDLTVTKVPDCDHSELPEVMGYPEYRQAIIDFVLGD
jgi:pimeloyl-ACP methyl ester carboxylesterase